MPGIWFASLTTLYPMPDKELLFNKATQVINDKYSLSLVIRNVN